MPNEASDITALGMGFAGGAVMGALLDELVNRGVLSVGDVRHVLQNASNGVVAFYGSDIGREAGRVIAGLFARFPEDRT